MSISTAASITAAALAFCASLALAQDPSTSGVFVPEWQDELPHTGPWYPHGALERGVDGAAVLCCGPGDANGIACRVAREQPLKRHFGDAALRISQELRLTPMSAAAFRENSQEIEMTFVFRFTRGFRRIGTFDIRHSGVCHSDQEFD